MHITFPDQIPVAELEEAFAILFETLRQEGLDNVSNMSVSFDGWRGEDCCEIVDDEGTVRSVAILRLPHEHGTERIKPALPEGVVVQAQGYKREREGWEALLWGID